METVFQIGDKVRWFNPYEDEFAEENLRFNGPRIFTVVDVPDDTEWDSIVLIRDDYSEFEVFADQLELVV